MRRAERRRKFHEAVVETLYPPSSPDQSDDDDKPVTTKAEEIFDVELINPEDFLDTRPPDNDNDDDGGGGGGGGESGLQKLSRAQRKRLRKRKLKEEAAVRGNMIGPLLPLATTTNSIDDKNGSQGVRRNANENLAATDENPEEEHDRDDRNKQKQRRMAKKLAKEKCNSTEPENGVI